jgi:hypothetical protein
MTQQDKPHKQQTGRDSGQQTENEPGRTPGAAEGDRQTVEESLRDKSPGQGAPDRSQRGN